MSFPASHIFWLGAKKLLQLMLGEPCRCTIRGLLRELELGTALRYHPPVQNQCHTMDSKKYCSFSSIVIISRQIAHSVQASKLIDLSSTSISPLHNSTRKTVLSLQCIHMTRNSTVPLPI